MEWATTTKQKLYKGAVLHTLHSVQRHEGHKKCVGYPPQNSIKCYSFISNKNSSNNIFFKKGEGQVFFVFMLISKYSVSNINMHFLSRNQYHDSFLK